MTIQFTWKDRPLLKTNSDVRSRISVHRILIWMIQVLLKLILFYLMKNDDFYKSGLTEIRRARVWEVLVVGREESFVFSREILGLKIILNEFYTKLL